MNIDAIKNTLNKSFQNLREITPDIFCAMDKYHDKPYAVRYFDLSDNIGPSSEGLNEYLEKVLSEDYFDEKWPIDLRWNNYMYFITSDEHQQDDAFLRAKFIIESDREYARKFVVTEKDLPNLFSSRVSTQASARSTVPIQDLFSTWLKLLNKTTVGLSAGFQFECTGNCTSSWQRGIEKARTSFTCG